jgi:hypothetical protein
LDRRSGAWRTATPRPPTGSSPPARCCRGCRRRDRFPSRLHRRRSDRRRRRSPARAPATPTRHWAASPRARTRRRRTPATSGRRPDTRGSRRPRSSGRGRAPARSGGSAPRRSPRASARPTPPSSHWAAPACLRRERISSISATYIAGYIGKYNASARDGGGGFARLFNHTVQTRSPAVQVSKPRSSDSTPTGPRACSQPVRHTLQRRSPRPRCTPRPW